MSCSTLRVVFVGLAALAPAASQAHADLIGYRVTGTIRLTVEGTDPKVIRAGDQVEFDFFVDLNEGPVFQDDFVFAFSYDNPGSEARYNGKSLGPLRNDPLLDWVGPQVKRPNTVSGRVTTEGGYFILFRKYVAIGNLRRDPLTRDFQYLQL